MIRRILFIILALATSTLAWSQGEPGPDITCVSVVNDTQVKIDWVAPDPAEVSSFPGIIPTRYLVYRSSSYDGIFTEIYDVNYNAAVTDWSYIDPTASADLGSKYYYVVLEYFSSPILEIPSETISTIYVEMVNNVNSVSLSWNLEHTIHGAAVILEKKVANDPWFDYFIGNANFTEFEELINNCHGAMDNIAISYRIRTENSAGCINYSNTATGLFQDTNPPDMPVIETISVDYLANQAHIFWTPSTAPDVGGYLIHDGFSIVGSVNDGSADNFVVTLPNPGNNPSEGSVGYYVLPFDDCIHGSNINPNTGSIILGVTPLNETIFLQAAYDVCSKSVQVNWNQYDDWLLGVNRYELNVSIDGGAFEVIEILDASSQSIILRNLVENENYCFVVTAYPNDNSLPLSTSNQVCLVTDYPVVASDFGMENVTVVSNNETEVSFYIDPAVQGARYRLEKLGEYQDLYEAIGTYSQNIADANDIITITDINVDNDSDYNSYRVVAIDSCLNDIRSSKISNSIHLEVFPDEIDVDNTLTWNPYVNWQNDVQEYQVFFNNTANMPIDPKFVIDPSGTFEIDDIFDYFHIDTDFCYQIVAKELGTEKLSRSNVKCVSFQPILYIPNAIMINGENPIFKPEGGFIEFQNYQMSIFNRWGIPLFYTDDFFTGWDGTYKGDYVREGVYTYFITYKSGTGKVNEVAGSITVLRAY